MIGRQKECRILDELLKSPESELLAVIGRRRIGKTYLIREHYKQQLAFDFTGTQHAKADNQLKKFATKLQQYGKYTMPPTVPPNWAQAFEQLTVYLSGLRKRKEKRVVFFDELPWIDSHRSGFLNELSYWWNDWASQQSIIVVICGSAASWMIQKVINHKGGLHNRVTAKIHLQPFTLSETRKYVHTINPKLNNYSILQLYMVFGGIPFYLRSLKKGDSATQSIQRLCFDKDGMMRTEFENLYAALYDKPERHISVIKALATKWKGLTRKELIKLTGIADGGGLTKILTELESASFIMTVQPFGKKKKNMLYRLIDEYSLFYLNFIEHKRAGNQNIWLQTSQNQVYKSWRGYAFENICIKHAYAITQALGISGMHTSVSGFISKGVQVDMLIDRADDVINLCEMKFYNDDILLTKEDAATLRRRRTLFIEQSKTKKTVFINLITSFGLRSNQYSEDLVDQIVTIEDLFLLKNF